MFEKSSRVGISSVLSLSALTILLVLPIYASADSESATESSSAVEQSAAAEAENTGTVQQDSGAAGGASGLLSKLSVHGFLTQAYATSKFVDPPIGPQPPFGMTIGPLGASPNFLELSLGIPEDGTTNYRFLALQFRYDSTPKDIFVIQFSSRTLGFSPIQDFEQEVELDWAFYERRLTDQTSLKVGRVQIPYGIYNEYRDVGTVLPFYRPSFLFYKEGSFTSETVDGLLLSHTFFAQSPWSVDVSAYAGEWESIQTQQDNPALSGVVRASDGYGYEIWLNTPISDLRVGAGLLSFNQDGGPVVPADRRDVFHFSLDASLGRFTLQSEITGEEVDIVTPFGLLTVKPREWYVLGGLRITDKFLVWAQFEEAEFTQKSPAFLRSYHAFFRKDIGVALNYYFSPAILLKGEYHWVEDGGANFFFNDPSGLIRPETWAADGGSYSIVALSVSF